MTFFPILERELRVRARGRSTYWARFGVGLIGVLVCLPTLLDSGGAGSPGSGHGLFDALVLAAFILSCLACLVTADAISAERREGTLGLLLLTRVRALDLLLGKLGSAGLTAVSALVVLLPLLMLSLLAGGVTAGEALRKWLAVLNTLFLSIAAGLFSSAAVRYRVKAANRAFVLMLLLVVLPQVLAYLFQRAPGGVALLSPLYSLETASDTAYVAAPAAFWWSLLAVQVCGWLLLLGARAGLARSVTQEEAEVEHQPGAGQRVLPTLPPWLARGELAPIEWLVLRQPGIKGAAWLAAILAAGSQFLIIPFVFGFSSYYASPWLLFGQIPSIVLAVITGSLLAWSATRFFVQARRSGELELLLTLPLGGREICSGQWRALVRVLRWPVVLMVAPFAWRLWMMWERTSQGGGFTRYFESLTWFGMLSLFLGVGTTLLGVAAVCWVGLWFALNAQGQVSAIARTVGVVKGFPVLVSLLWFLNSRALPFGSRYTIWYRLLSVAVQGTVFLGYVWLIGWARRRVLKQLAGVEPQPGDTKEYLTQKLAGAVGMLRRARHWTPSGPRGL